MRVAQCRIRLLPTLISKIKWTQAWTTLKTSMWKDYVFGWMSHPTHVISLSPEGKRYVLIWIKLLTPLTRLKFNLGKCRIWNGVDWSSFDKNETCSISPEFDSCSKFKSNPHDLYKWLSSRGKRNFRIDQLWRFIERGQRTTWRFKFCSIRCRKGTGLSNELRNCNCKIVIFFIHNFSQLRFRNFS